MNPILALIIANIIWGAGSPIYKAALTNVPTFILMFSRLFIPALIFLPFLFKIKQKISFRQYSTLFLMALIIAIHYPLYFLGIQKTLSINAPVIASSSPVFLFFLSVFFLKEKFRIKVLVGMLISFIGVLIIIFSPLLIGGNIIAVDTSIEGNLFLLLATLLSLFVVIIGKRILTKIHPFYVAFWTFFLSGIMISPFMVMELDSWSISNLNFIGIVGLVFGILFGSVIAHALYYYGLKKIQTEEVGVFTYICPVIAVLIAIPLLGEYPNKFFIIGSFIIFWGIYFSEGRIPWHPFHKLKKNINKDN
ncbi:MAG: DMT family transporter [bacterium]